MMDIGGDKMSYIVVIKDNTPLAYNRNNAVECAMRTLCKITGKKFFSDANIMMCKCPDKMGDMTAVGKFYERYPSIIANNNDIYDENEAAEYYLNTLKGSKVTVGYGLVSYLCDGIYVEYSIIEDSKI